MNIIEAIKSGKPFRRKNICMDWIFPTDEFMNVSFFSAIQNDWEIQEKTITITESQFYHTLSDSLKEFHSKREITHGIMDTYRQDWFVIFKEKLGF